MIQPVRPIGVCVTALLVWAGSFAAVARTPPRRSSAAPLAAISGRLLDEQGVPVVDAAVRVGRLTATSGGHLYLFGATETLTDARGAYRFDALPPGEYVVVAPAIHVTIPDSVAAEVNGMPSIPGFHIGHATLQQVGDLPGHLLMGPAPTGDDRVLVYQTVYYPSAATLSTAAALAIGPGQERKGVDLVFRAVPTTRVSGTINGPDGPAAHTGVRLIVADDGDAASDVDFETAVTVTDATGAFTFLGVPHGKYTLKVLKARPPASYGLPPYGPPPGSNGNAGAGGAPFQAYVPPAVDPLLWARTTVSVGRADVTGLAVTLQSGLHVSGRVQFDGAPPTMETLQRISISFSPWERPDRHTGEGGVVKPDGTFVVQGLTPGRYRIGCEVIVAPDGSGSDWSLKSVMLGNHALPGALLTLRTTDRDAASPSRLLSIRLARSRAPGDSRQRR